MVQKVLPCVTSTTLTGGQIKLHALSLYSKKSNISDQDSPHGKQIKMHGDLLLLNLIVLIFLDQVTYNASPYKLED